MTATTTEEAVMIARGWLDDTVSPCGEDADKVATALLALADENKRLRAAANVAAERLVFAKWIYAPYIMKARGPTGCIMDALDAIAPNVAVDMRELDDERDVYAKHWADDLEFGEALALANPKPSLPQGPVTK